MFGFHPPNKYTCTQNHQFFIVCIYFLYVEVLFANNVCFAAVKPRRFNLFSWKFLFLNTLASMMLMLMLLIFFSQHSHLHLHASMVNGKTHKWLDPTLWKSVDLWIYELDFYYHRLIISIFIIFIIIFPLAVGEWEIQSERERIKLALYCAMLHNTLLLLFFVDVVDENYLFYRISIFSRFLLERKMHRFVYRSLSVFLFFFLLFCTFECHRIELKLICLFHLHSRFHFKHAHPPAIFMSQSSTAWCVRSCQTNLYIFIFVSLCLCVFAHNEIWNTRLRFIWCAFTCTVCKGMWIFL